MSRIVPHVLGLTYNGLRENNAQQALRIPFSMPLNATRWRLSLAPGLQDAEETTLDVSGVTMTGAVLGRHGSGGVMTEALHSFGSQDLSSGSWLSPWVNTPLVVDEQLVLSWGYTNPSGRSIAAGSMGVYRSTTASDFSNIGGSAWTKDGMVHGPMSPAIIYETPGTPKIVAVVGDSNTAGRGAALPYHESFSHVTARRLNQIVVPLGYTGETLSDYYEPTSSSKWTRLRDLCGGGRWDGVIIQAGINDISIGRPATHLQDSMPQVASKARTYLADTVYAATLPPASFDASKETQRNTYNNWLNNSTPQATLDGVIDLATPVTNSGNPAQLQSIYNSGDNIHYNAAGHTAMSPMLDAMINFVTVSGMEQPPNGATVFMSTNGNRVVFRSATSWLTNTGLIPIVINPPTGLTADFTHDTITLSWIAATGDSPVTGYEVRLGGGLVIDAGNVTTRQFSGLTPETIYTLEVRAYDAEGNYSNWASTVVSTDAAPVGGSNEIIHSQIWDLGARNESSIPIATNIQTVSFTTSPTAGNLLYTVLAIDKNQLSGANAPAGWTLFSRTANAGVTMLSAWKISDGTETSIRWAPNTSQITGGYIIGYVEASLTGATIGARNEAASASTVKSMSANLGTVGGGGRAFVAFTVDTGFTAWTSSDPQWSSGWTEVIKFRQSTDITGGPPIAIATKVFDNETVAITAIATNTDEHALHVVAFNGVG